MKCSLNADDIAIPLRPGEHLVAGQNYHQFLDYKEFQTVSSTCHCVNVSAEVGIASPLQEQ